MDRTDAPRRCTPYAATPAGCPTLSGHAGIVCDQLRALLEAAGYRLDAAIVSAAVGHAFADVGTRLRQRAPGAVMEDRFRQLARTADPRGLSALFAGLGSLCAELDLIPQALAAYRQALHYSLHTHDPVLSGTVRGRLARLAMQDQRPVRAAVREAATGDASHG